MRIGILTQWFDPEPGPAALPGALARSLRDRGHDVQVVTGFPNYPTGQIAEGYRISARSDEQIDGIRVRRTALVPSHDASLVGRLVNWTSFALSSTALGLGALRKADAVWVSNSPVTMALPAWVVAKVLRKPTVLHVLDLWPDNVLSSGLVERTVTVRALVRVLHLVTGHMYRSAGRVAVLSPGARELLIARGVEPSKIDIVPLWADEDRFYPGSGEEVRTKMGVDAETVVVLYAGALGGTQQIEALVTAGAGRAPDAPPLEVWIAGSGVRETAIRELMEASTTPSVRFQFLGRIPMERMAGVMHAADVHFVGLRDDDLSRVTMPSKIQATMASGKPIVVAVRGDAEDAVMRAGAGFAALPGDPPSIRAAIESAATLGRSGLAELGRRARQAYEEFYSLRSAARTIELALKRAAGE